MVTNGVAVYPLPGLVTVILVILKLALPVTGPLITATAVAPDPLLLVLEIVTCGT